MVRHLIISVDQDPKKILLYALGILTLVVALGVLEFKSFYLHKKKKEIGEGYFEL